MLRPAFCVQLVEGEGVFLLSERHRFVLTGELYCLLAPLLDGSHTADEIVDRLAAEAAPAEVYYALRLLESKGYVVEADGIHPWDAVCAGRIAFWDGLGLDPASAARRLATARVILTGFGAVSLEALERALATLGVPVGSDGEFALVATDDYLESGLEGFNSTSLALGRPWLLVKPVGTVLWIGPVFHPGRTACWECLAVRLRGNRRVESYVQSRTGAPWPLLTPSPTASAAGEMAAHLAAIETVKAIGGGLEGPAEADVVTLDLMNLRTETHRVVKRPQCPVCGTPPDGSRLRLAPLILRSHRKRFTLDGGHRAVAPNTTLAAQEHHVSPITGAVGSLSSVSVDRDGLIRFYVAAHASPQAPRTLEELRHLLQEVSAGKGMTEAQARASGLCEGLERYSGYFWGDEVRQRASYHQLGGTAIHPNSCMLFSERQYDRRQERNASGSIYEAVPAIFDEEAAIEWTPVWSLTAQEFKYLPSEYCYAHFTDPAQPGGRYCLPDSNGNAAGNTLEEAILQGFMELVERDAVALWWYNRLRRPGVDLGRFEDPYIRELRRQYRSLHRDVWLLDLTSDLEVPVYAAVSRRTDGAADQVAWGFGAHFDARMAALRALTEMNQHLPRVSRTDVSDTRLDPRAREWYRAARLADHPFLTPDDTPPRDPADCPAGWSDDLREDVLRCQEIVERHSMQMLVLDQTRPEIGLPVVKVIVPGLRHFRPRLAPGRLYDVPVRLGWLDEPLAEAALNPLPYVFP